MLRSFILAFVILSASALIPALSLPSLVHAQTAVQPFDMKACIANKEVPPEECDILSCMARPQFNRKQCTCMRDCAMNFMKCYKAEADAGSSKEAAQVSCDVNKDQCARECILNNRGAK